MASQSENTSNQRHMHAHTDGKVANIMLTWPIGWATTEA